MSDSWKVPGQGFSKCSMSSPSGNEGCLPLSVQGFQGNLITVILGSRTNTACCLCWAGGGSRLCESRQDGCSSFESQLVEKPKPTGAKGGQDWEMNSTHSRTHILTGKLNKPKEGSLVMMSALKTGQRPLDVCSMLTREVLLQPLLFPSFAAFCPRHG